MDGDSDSDPFLEDESLSDDDQFNLTSQRIKENNPVVTELRENGGYERIQNMTGEEWEELGRDISNNTYLEKLEIVDGALDDHKMSFFFRGLTSSNSINEIALFRSGLSVEGLRSMVPFLQNANNLTMLDLDDNNIRSEGFTVLIRALSNSPIETLSCDRCGIESVEIDNDYFPRHLEFLQLDANSINSGGCRGLAKLLQGEDPTLITLQLDNNHIDDEGVAVLVNALQNNTSLKTLDLRGNDDMTSQGKMMLLKLVCDISSIKATRQSNHTLRHIKSDGLSDADRVIELFIDMATMINRNEDSPEAVGRKKVIKYQLHSRIREKQAALQGIDHSVYSEIDPLHLPEVLALVGRRHGQGELHVALSSSIITLLSTVNRKKYVQQQRDYHEAKAAEHRAKAEELNAELATMEEETEEGNEQGDEVETQNSKRRRV